MKGLVRYLSAILIFLTILACETEANKEPLDFNLIPEDQFSELLAEIQLIESQSTVLRVMQPVYKDSLPNYYAGLFEKYDITAEDYYYSLEEYSKSPEKFDPILNNALAILKNKEANLKDTELPKEKLQTLSRQQLGDIIYETPVKDLMIEIEVPAVSYMKDTFFSYIDAHPEIVEDRGYDIPSVKFSFVINSNTKNMYKQLKNYLENKDSKAEGID